MSEDIYKAYRYRLYPNREVQSIFNQWFGCCRKVFNVTLDESIKQYEAGNKEFVNRKSMFSMITKLKADGEHDYLKQVPIHTLQASVDNLLTSYDRNKEFVNRKSMFSMITKLKADGEHDYLKQVPIHTLQASVDNLLTSYDRFFAKFSGFPKFKSKHESKQSFTVRCSPSIIKNCRFDNNRVWIPNLKKLIKFKQHRKIEGIVKSYTITREATGKWYISFLCQTIAPQKIERDGVVGLDFGVIDFFTDSRLLENGILAFCVKLLPHKRLKEMALLA